MTTTKALDIILLFLLIFFILFLLPKKNKKETKSKDKYENSRLTKEKLRNYKCTENITTLEAEEVIFSLKKFCEITFKLFQQEKIKSNTL